MNKMRISRGAVLGALTLVVALTSFCQAEAQKNDPVIMTIAGQPVLRSEFEYSYNKNNAEGVIDKKTVEEYVDLFVNYKLKVQAAIDEHLDTLSSFKEEFATYRNQQVRPAFITDADVEAEARNIYNRTQHMVDSLGGLIHPSHILLSVKQKAPETEDAAAKTRIDSIYNALKGGADFATLATKFSDDKASAARGGDLSWIQPRQTVKEFEDAAYALKPGEMSKPVRSPFGYHIILLQERRNFFPYDSLRSDIIRFIEARGIREQIIDQKLDSLSKATGDDRAFLLDKKAEELSEKDSDMRNLIREYHDGLLLFEIGNRKVWDKATKDDAGLAKFFAENKKNYDWEEPRYKGIAYHTKDKKDLKAVKKCVKGVPFEQWGERLRSTFNNDSIIRIRAEKGVFKKGDNAFIDKMVFKKDTTVNNIEGYPYNAVFGKKLKKGPEDYRDVRALVVADYQEWLEKQWVAELRKRYSFKVNDDVLKTVNKH